MPKKKHPIVELRSYELPEEFPLLLLSGENWYISDIPSQRMHIHNCLEVGLCESGLGTLILGNDQVEFRPHDITVISSNIPHATHSMQGTSSKWSYLFLDLDALLAPLLSYIDSRAFDFLSSDEYSLRLVLHQDSEPFAYELVSRIISEFQEKRPFYQISICGFLLSFFSMLSRISFFPEQKEAAKTDAGATLPIAPALNYIRLHYGESFPMEHLARLCGLSSSHFRKVFTSVMGTSPVQYLHWMRITKACSLLRTTQHSILHISEQVGFSSISSFNRNFLSITGQSPTQWRKQNSALRGQSLITKPGWKYSKGKKQAQH